MTKAKLIFFFSLSVAFFIAGLASTFYFGKQETTKDQASRISSALQKELIGIDNEAAALVKAVETNTRWEGISDSFFLVDSTKVLQWTTNDFLPDLRVLQGDFSLRLLQVGQGDFLIKKWPLKEQQTLFAVLPLHKDYKIVNNYLAPIWNSDVFLRPVRIVPPTGVGEPVYSSAGTCLFKVVSNDTTQWLNKPALTCIALSVGCFLIFVFGLCSQFHEQRRYGLAFVTMAIALTTLRIAMVKLNYPNVYSDFVLFDPHRFASSSFNASMGDLLLNSLSILALCLYLFLNYYRMPFVRKLLALPRTQRMVAATVCLVICFLALLYPYLFMEVIYHNSSISLEITDTILIDLIRVTAILSLLVGCISSFLFIHVFFRLAVRCTGERALDFWTSLAIATLISAVYIVIGEKSYWITLLTGIVFFSLLYSGRVMAQFNRFTFKTFLYFLVVIVVLACQGALSLRKFNEERSVRDQFRFGNRFLVDQDVLGEFLLNESAQQIAKDPFIQATLVNPFISKNGIRQKVKQFYLSTYFDRYDIQTYLFGPGGEPYGSDASADFGTLIRNYQNEANKTAYPGIYFVNTPTGEVTQQYLVIVPVVRRLLSAGFIVLNLRLKKIIPRNVYPELLVDNRFSHYFIGKDFSYAFYTQGKLTNSFGDFNYDKEFNRELLADRTLYSGGISENGQHHIGIEDRNGQTAVVTAKDYSAFSLITNFSFLFVLGLMVVLCVLVITSIITWWRGANLDYAARIQLYVYLAFFLPLVTVSVTTLSLTSRTAEDQLQKEYVERSKSFGETMAKPQNNLQKEASGNWSENQITELAKLADLDASVYGKDGLLIASSQPMIFANRLTSVLINRKAWNAIVLDGESAIITNETIGKLQYNCSYSAIKSAETGAVIGVLSIPFFGSAQSLEKIQINVLANMLTIFVLVFILFSVFSFFIARGLTFPLRFIARSIKKTTLTGKNQVIQWNSNDEIGLLANEYNKMIRNLELSSYNLARVQKESAWREIAKQVAHEIKNPLTPMKLTLQQMEKSMDNQNLNPEKTKKAVETLLEQLEILNEIATSFSTFARMPAPEFERIDLDDLLRNVVSLHQNSPEGTVTLLPGLTSKEVLGNSQLLGRAFANIILNALQSSKDGIKVAVKVSARVTGDKVLVRFEDNGRGIDKDIQDKVFLPNFSTKRTGSGLGLAIAKQGIEQTGGRIWFETHLGKGTTFFVELVIVDSPSAR